MANTTPDLITYPLGTDPVAPLHTVFATQATSVQTALTNLRNRFPQPVASTAERDAVFPTPAQGNRVYRTDKGYHEAYFALYNATTNPGGARSAGWYPVDGNIFGKAIRNPTFSVGGSDVPVAFDATTGTTSGMWTSSDPTRLLLPIVGLWEIKGWATTSGGDGGVLRGTVTVNGAGAALGDNRDNVSGVGGVTDPFVNPHGIVEVQNTSSTIQFIVSQGGKSSMTVQPNASMWAKYLGPGRF